MSLSSSPGVSLRLTSDLRDLPQAFDVFEPQPPPDVDLLRRGLVRPILVCDHGLVWGRGQVDAAWEAGIAALPCTEMPTAPPAEVFRTALLLEDRAGRYSWAEKSRMATHMGPGMDPKDRDALVARIDGHPDNDFVERVEAYRGLAPEVRRLVDEGRMDLRVARVAASLPAGWVGLLHHRPRLTNSRLRLLVTLADEIIRRDGLRDESALHMMREVLSQNDPAATIEELRRPGLARLRRDVSAVVESALGRLKITVTPPADLEGNEIEVRFTFADRLELRRNIDGLRSLEGRTDELFRLFR